MTIGEKAYKSNLFRKDLHDVLAKHNARINIAWNNGLEVDFDILDSYGRILYAGCDLVDSDYNVLLITPEKIAKNLDIKGIK